MSDLKTVPLPNTDEDRPRAALCWKSDDRPNSPNPMVHCDRKLGHQGLHSWELTRERAEKGTR